MAARTMAGLLPVSVLRQLCSHTYRRCCAQHLQPTGGVGHCRVSWLVSCSGARRLFLRNLRWWLLAQMPSMAAVGTLVTIGLWALGVPLAGTLGIIADLMTFIPNLGPILSVFPAALLAIAISPVTR